MSAFLSRIVRKGMGARSDVIAPNMQPHFPPPEPGAEAASLDRRGELIFGSEAEQLLVPNTPNPGSDANDRITPAQVTHMQAVPSTEATRHSSSLPERSSEVLLPIVSTLGPFSREAREGLRAGQSETREQLSAGRTPAEAGQIIELAADVEIRTPELPSEAARPPILVRDRETQITAAQSVASIEAPSRGAGDFTVHEEVASPGLDEFIVHAEVPMPQHGEFFARENDGRIVEQRREVANGNQTAVWRRPPVSDGSPIANEETVVQVRIGRIEVRMNGGTPVPAPGPARVRGPRGFAGYESVRRYLTRSRT